MDRFIATFLLISTLGALNACTAIHKKNNKSFKGSQSLSEKRWNRPSNDEAFAANGTGAFLQQSLANVPAGGAEPAGIEIRTVSVLQDLVKPSDNGEVQGCDIWQPHSLRCRWASFEKCRALGYEGGWGPVEYNQNVAQIACFRSSAGSYQEFAMQGLCDDTNYNSLFCDSLTRRQCQAIGFKSAIGVIGANLDTHKVGTVCLKASSDIVERDISLDELTVINPAVRGCTEESLVNGNGCQHQASRACQQEVAGAVTGFEVLEYNGATRMALIACAKGVAYTDGFQMLDANEGFFDPTNGDGFKGYLRPASTQGDMILGGPVSNQDLTFHDAIVNTTSQPLLITRIDFASNFVSNTGKYSRDMVLFLNRGGIWQFENSFDGESLGVYSNERAMPSVNFEGASYDSPRAFVLRPNERLVFQGTPQWGQINGTGLYAWAKVHIEPYGARIPVRRVRFPQWDTVYHVNANSRTTVRAGCVNGPGDGLQVGQCDLPEVVPTGKAARTNSNRWFSYPKPINIRGISFFLSNGGLIDGQSRKINGCLRIGGNVASCFDANPAGPQAAAILPGLVLFDFTSPLFGPSSFRQFGAQNNSNFIRLDYAVGPNTPIGVDFSFSSPTDAAMDLATWLWVEGEGITY